MKESKIKEIVLALGSFTFVIQSILITMIFVGVIGKTTMFIQILFLVTLLLLATSLVSNLAIQKITIILGLMLSIIGVFGLHNENNIFFIHLFISMFSIAIVLFADKSIWPWQEPSVLTSSDQNTDPSESTMPNSYRVSKETLEKALFNFRVKEMYKKKQSETKK